MDTTGYTLDRFEALLAAACAAVEYHEGAPAIDALQAAVEAISGPIFAYRDEEA